MFSRAFSSDVQPVELARKLAKEMDAHKTASVQRVYVPNEYTVWLCPDDHERFEGYERSLEQELSGYLLEHARRHDYDLLTRPEVEPRTDERLRLGEFGIQTRLVQAAARARARSRSRASRATRWSTRPPSAPEGPLQAPAATQPVSETRAIVSVDDRRYVLDGPPATIGRSKEADCVLATRTSRAATPSCAARTSGTGRSSTSARPTGSRSTAGASPTPGSRPGDEVTLGTTIFAFDIEQ